MIRLTVLFISGTFFFLLFLSAPSYAATYYISPNGNNSNAGTSESAPIQSFSTAWSKIKRGDTLILLDGIYTPSTTGIMQVSVPNDDGRRIYIKAKNTGKAVIDAQFQVKSPVDIAFYRGGKNLEIEGIVAKNSGIDSNATGAVYYFDTGRTTNANILLKKVSGYNAHEDANSAVFTFYQSSGITIEDCIAAGSGRKMILLYQSSNNVVRRCVARWLKFDGRNFCGGLSWPAGSGLEIYYGNNNIIENNIGFGNVAYYHFALKGYDIADGNEANNNKFLGNMSLYAGKYADGMPVRWGTKPTGSQCSDTGFNETDIMNGFQTVGLSAGVGYMGNNLYQDNLAYKDGGYATAASGGPNWYGTGWTNNTMNRVTFVGNGSLRTSPADILREELDKYTVTNSKIDKISNGSSMNNGRAQLQNRYVNGILTSESLWPWPMEDQVKEQFNTHLANDTRYNYAADNSDLRNFSITQRVCEQVLKGDPAVAAATNCNSGPTPTGPTATPSPTNRPQSPTPTSLVTISPTGIGCSSKSQGDADCNGIINLIDFEIWRKEYMLTLATKTADYNTNGTVDLVDFEIWRKSFLK